MIKIKNEEEYPYMKYQIITLFILIIAIALGLLYGSKSYIEKGKKISKERYEYWFKQLQEQNINKVTLVLDEVRYRTKDHGDSWAKIINMYVNDIEVQPETVFNYKKFVFKHCDSNFYYKGHIRNIDSIIYEFFPNRKFYKHNKKKKTFENAYLSSPDKRYSNVLPKCED